MIKTILIGHLGRDAVVNDVSGYKVINFSVAHSEKYTDRNNVQQNKTLWVECSWWTEKHNIVPYLKKGTQVFVEGRPDVRLFEYPNGGTGVSMTMRVQSVQLLGNKQQEIPPHLTQEPDKHINPDSITEPVDDLPF